MKLDHSELRVLGSLIEKELSTPEYYPLTLNALVNACNQKSNRDPVVSYDDNTVMLALDGLREKKLVYQDLGSGRVPKYGHNLPGVLNLLQKETAALTVMILRGPQTPGEIRSRSGRMHDFKSLEEVLEALESLKEADLITVLARQPGRKEVRYAHLLGDPPEPSEAGGREDESAVHEGRAESLEARVSELEAALKGLREEFDSFKKQFE